MSSEDPLDDPSRPRRPEHAPRGHEWLPDIISRCVDEQVPQIVEIVRVALAEGDLVACLRDQYGERHIVPRRMWDKEPVEEKVLRRFSDGWMKMKLDGPNRRFVAGWVFAPTGRIEMIVTEATSPRRLTMAAEKKCENWLVHEMRTGPKNQRKIDYYQDARRRFGVAHRAFERAWRSAISHSKSDWYKPGRIKRKSTRQ